jgi:hypothetical protein
MRALVKKEAGVSAMFLDFDQLSYQFILLPFNLQRLFSCSPGELNV